MFFSSSSAGEAGPLFPILSNTLIGFSYPLSLALRDCLSLSLKPETTMLTYLFVFTLIALFLYIFLTL